MSRFDELRAVPETLTADFVRSEISIGQTQGFHESLLKSYQVLQLVKVWLELRVPAEVILDAINHAYERRAIP